MSVTDDEFRGALSLWPSGVSVVTAAVGSQMHGMTVSSFSSVSLRPPLVSVCLATESRTLELARQARAFCISILSEQQASVSDRFAVTQEDSERLNAGSFRLAENGCPLLEGAIAHLVCDWFAEHEAGDHHLLIGRVVQARSYPGAPLLYCGRGYGVFRPL